METYIKNIKVYKQEFNKFMKLYDELSSKHKFLPECHSCSVAFRQILDTSNYDMVYLYMFQTLYERDIVEENDYGRYFTLKELCKFIEIEKDFLPNVKYGQNLVK